jgi:hypothetical protein
MRTPRSFGFGLWRTRLIAPILVIEKRRIEFDASPRLCLIKFGYYA